MAYSDRCEVILIVVLIWISFISDSEHIFMCLLATCMSSLKKMSVWASTILILNMKTNSLWEVEQLPMSRRECGQKQNLNSSNNSQAPVWFFFCCGQVDKTSTRLTAFPGPTLLQYPCRIPQSSLFFSGRKTKWYGIRPNECHLGLISSPPEFKVKLWNLGFLNSKSCTGPWGMHFESVPNVFTHSNLKWRAPGSGSLKNSSSAFNHCVTWRKMLSPGGLSVLLHGGKKIQPVRNPRRGALTGPYWQVFAVECVHWFLFEYATKLKIECSKPRLWIMWKTWEDLIDLDFPFLQGNVSKGWGLDASASLPITRAHIQLVPGSSSVPPKWVHACQSLPTHLALMQCFSPPVRHTLKGLESTPDPYRAAVAGPLQYWVAEWHGIVRRRGLVLCVVCPGCSVWCCFCCYW